MDIVLQLALIIIPAGAVMLTAIYFLRNAAQSEMRSMQIELKKAREELIKLNFTKDKFYSIVAHDLRTPVSGLQMLSELIIQKYSSMSEEDIFQYIGKIKVIFKNIV